jgi:glucosamine kinase
VEKPILLLGVDGGGTRCRARLAEFSGTVLGEGTAGPANIGYGIEDSFAAVLEATRKAFVAAGLQAGDLNRIVACLALAGASEPALLAAARRQPHPFLRAVFTADAHAACVGAHQGRDGGIIVAGTGTIGWAIIAGETYRCGGWGFPVSDEGSGAWFGCEALRRVLWAYDGRIAWTALLRTLFAEFDGSPHAIVSWTRNARPGDFARFAPRVAEFAAARDVVGVELMRLGAKHIDWIAARLTALGAPHLALVGGLAKKLTPWLNPATEARMIRPEGDAMAGALKIARIEAQSLLVVGT